jgi:hypothetical protein
VSPAGYYAGGSCTDDRDVISFEKEAGMRGAQMSFFFEIVIGILVLILGARIYASPYLVVLGHQLEMAAYNKPLGVLLGISGLLWLWLGLKRKATGK